MPRRFNAEKILPKRIAVLAVLTAKWHIMVELQDRDHIAAEELEEASKTTGAVGLPPEPPVTADDVNAVLEKLFIPRHLPSIIDLKRALPRHVFDRCLSTSLFYALKDVVQVAVSFSLAEWAWSSGLLPVWLLLLLLPVYLLVQGIFFTAIFVVGHDASHSSFSRHEWLNDIVGAVFNAFLLNPYYIFKVTHRNHHKNTGNIDKDEAYYPIRKKPCSQKLLAPGFGVGLDWFLYALPGNVNQFNPKPRRYAVACIISFAIVMGWTVILWQYVLSAGFIKLLIHFIIPDVIFLSFFVIITFLQHTEEGIPWYADSHWEPLRGQLSTVDRHYGWCHDVIHSIGTHQIHHLFPQIPHYHLEEATRVFRNKFPQLVHVRHDPILPAFWRMLGKFASSYLIDDSTKIHLY